MEIVTDFLCLESGSIDILYISEIDPLWQDSELTAIINPEAVLFANPLALAACAADCVSATVNLPVDEMFWCAGCQGSMYPMNGNVSASIGHVQASRRSEEHTSELQSLMRISYAVFCLKTK